MSVNPYNYFMLCLAGLVFGCGGTQKAGPRASLKHASETRPRVELRTKAVFDQTDIPGYAGDHPSIYAHIDVHIDSHLENLRRWVRQKSISPQNQGIHAMADLVCNDLRAMGFKEVALVKTGGHPGVWGYYDAGAPRTLLVYMMYDVQPADPRDWSTPPFQGSLVEHDLGTVLMARGATNQKGPERAFLNALDSIIRVEGNLPVNIMITAEGEEEIGSGHFPEIISRYEKRLKKANGVIFPMNTQELDGTLIMNLGVKGIIYFELEARGGKWGGPKHHEIHGSYKALVDSPVWRLIQALASLTTPDGNTITIPGYYQGIRAPTLEEERLINALADDIDFTQHKKLLGVDRWLDDLDGRAALIEYLYAATLNIDGIWGGYTGEGSKTVLPHKAIAKLDSRLPPGLSPERAYRLIRDHLDARGFGDILLRKLDEGYPAAQTSVSEPWVQAALGVFKKRRYQTQIIPRLAGSAPFYQFTQRLGLPLVFAAAGYGHGAHAPDEFMLIHPKPGVNLAGLAEIEKTYVDLVYAFAAMNAP